MEKLNHNFGLSAEEIIIFEIAYINCIYDNGTIDQEVNCKYFRFLDCKE